MFPDFITLPYLVNVASVLGSYYRAIGNKCKALNLIFLKSPLSIGAVVQGLKRKGCCLPDLWTVVDYLQNFLKSSYICDPTTAKAHKITGGTRNSRNFFIILTTFFERTRKKADLALLPHSSCLHLQGLLRYDLSNVWKEPVIAGKAMAVFTTLSLRQAAVTGRQKS